MLTRLAELRKSRRWTMQYISDQLGIAKSTYAGYESGYREPSLDTIKRISELYKTSVDYLLERTDDPSFNPKQVKINFPVELTDKTQLVKIQLAIDEKIISPEEFYHFIAFIRAKREIEQNGL
ncbi:MULTISPECIES: helix-turn-helix domain-containing protein [Metabacillus]|jgi:transcriptional regulator with XRE-family HTH domain|uniref:Helix-turn-helix domain-containing protein n=1 Tax=Metabacillus rhizolycopersici TaxID=2875709 RepID=A0ABS7UZU3_9BACI|nr:MULTISPECIES: helix-turn-helix domain-containing protein [Metabacillus]MBZ5753467.1 helix-turn-helix domain-containing protein [Metabacillus rhizolycopersici]MCM3654144.1 helix-turn-helix domain-containing protein [Metabacillus litoralis]